jgi:hypothetical protein
MSRTDSAGPLNTVQGSGPPVSLTRREYVLAEVVWLVASMFIESNRLLVDPIRGISTNIKLERDLAASALKAFSSSGYVLPVE